MLYNHLVSEDIKQLQAALMGTTRDRTNMIAKS